MVNPIWTLEGIILVYLNLNMDFYVTTWVCTIFLKLWNITLWRLITFKVKKRKKESYLWRYKIIFKFRKVQNGKVLKNININIFQD